MSRSPPRLDHSSIVGRKTSKPLGTSWSCTSCSKLLRVQRTCHRSRCSWLTTGSMMRVSGKASPPLVSTLFWSRTIIVTLGRTARRSRLPACDLTLPFGRATYPQPAQPPSHGAAGRSYCPLPPLGPRPVRGPASGVGVPGERAIVAVEDEADDLAGIHHVEGFLEKPPGRLVCPDDHQKAVHPLRDDAAVRHRDQRWGVEHDEIVGLARLLQELPHPWRLEYLVGGRGETAWRQDEEVERRTVLDHGLQREAGIQDRLHEPPIGLPVEPQLGRQRGPAQIRVHEEHAPLGGLS